MSKDREIEKVDALIKKATNAGCTEEEARTIALIACRLIVQHELKFQRAPLAGDIFEGIFHFNRNQSAPSPDPASQRRWPDAGPGPQGKAHRRAASGPARPPPETDKVIIAKHAGFCGLCNDTYQKGDRLIWMVRTRELVHPDCATGQGRTPDLG